MPKYRVNLVAIAEAFVEVEAEDQEVAIEIALNDGPTGANISNDFDMGDWQLPTDIWPNNKWVIDVEEID